MKSLFNAPTKALAILSLVFISQTSFSEVEKLNEIVVSGSRTSKRTSLSTATPIDIFTEADIKESGYTRTDQLLKDLAPSIHIQKPTISDGTDSLQPVGLRRLGPDHVIVLINGKRRHNSALIHFNGTVGKGSAGVDLAAIPVTAIKKIEVLRDGASAHYGSGAIAGVINIILKDKFSANQFSMNTGIYQEGDGAVIEGLSNYTVPMGNFLTTFSIQSKLKARTNRAEKDFRCNFVNSNEVPCTSQDPRELAFDRNNLWFGDNRTGSIHLWYNTTQKRRKKNNFYSFGGVSYRNSLGPGFYRQAKSNRNRPEIYPEGFLPKIQTNIIDLSTAVGYRTKYKKWDADASISYGYNSFNFNVENSHNVSLGVDSPREVNAGTLSEQLLVANLDFTKQQGRLWGSPLFWAVGGEAKLNNFSIKAGDEASWVNGGELDQFGRPGIPGIQVFPGFSPDNELSEYRLNLGSYAEASAQFNKLFAQAALRGEYYSDFGFSLTQKLAGQYQINKKLALRSSVSTGFRAPSLSQKFMNNRSTLFKNDRLVQVGTFNADSDLAKIIQLPQLEEEKSISLSTGLTYGSKRSRTTIDAYYTRVNDRVTLSRQFDKSDFGNLLSGPEFREIEQLQFFSNALDLQTLGLDIVHSGTAQMKRGFLTYSAGLNWGLKEIINSKNPDTLQSDVSIVDRSTKTLFTIVNPDSILTLKGSYKYRVWRFSGTVTRYGKYTTTFPVADDDDASNDQTFSPKWVTDTRVTKKMKNYSVGLGVNNLFGTLPDKAGPGNYNGIFPYSRIATPFRFNGRFFFVDISYQL